MSHHLFDDFEPSSPGRPPEYWDRFRRFINSCNEARLAGMLRTVQRRLGTVEERPDDPRHAREIAHRLRNLLTSVQLRAELPRLFASQQTRPGMGQDGSGGSDPADRRGS